MADKDRDKVSRDGGFSDPSFVSVGDPFKPPKDKPRGVDGQHKQFLTCPAKKGQTGATFGPGSRHFEPLGGTFTEQYKIVTQRRLENTKGFRKPNGFTFSSPTKQQYVTLLCSRDIDQLMMLWTVAQGQATSMAALLPASEVMKTSRRWRRKQHA